MLIFKRGDTFRFLVDVYDEVLDAPANLTGATAVCKLRQKSDQVIRTLAATITAPLTGTIEVVATAAATASWALGDAAIDIRITLSGGDVVTTSTATINIAAAESA